jgi:uncharacterized membrane protein
MCGYLESDSSNALLTSERVDILHQEKNLSPSTKPFLPSILFLSICFCVLMLSLAIASAAGTITPRLFALCAILLMLGLFISLTYQFRSSQTIKGNQDDNASSTEDWVQMSLSARRLRTSIVVMLLLLLSGLWFTRGGPLLPRLVGAALNLFITAGFVFLLRRAKKADSAR